MVNKVRGEVPVTLGGKQFAMRPTFAAMCEIEQATGMGIIGLVRRYRNLEFGFQDTAAIVTAGVRAGGAPEVTIEKVGEMMMEGGLIEGGLDTYARPVVQFLALALGGPTAGEAEATDPN